ncbi:MAG: hypothetical protein ABH878_03560 [bacterium]
MKEECKPFWERLCESLGEDLNSSLCVELREHLEACPECSLQIDTIKRTVEIYRALPSAEVPGAVQRRLRIRLLLNPEIRDRSKPL